MKPFKNIILSGGILCAVFVGNYSFCATKDKNKLSKNAQKKVKPSGTKTIADILSNIEKKSEKVNIAKAKSALPQANQKQLAPTQSTNLKDVQPPASKKLYYPEGTDEAALMRVTDESISQLFHLSNRLSKSSKRGEIWLRLGESYVEKAKLIEYRLLNQYDAKMQDFLSGKTKKKPKLNLDASIAYNKKAIQLYEWFIRDFPKDPKVDQSLFFLGFNYFAMNNPKQGEKYYTRLTKEYPQSPYVSESYFALGEYYFDTQTWDKAKLNYEHLLVDKTNQRHTFALYKMAWCYYKLNESKKGLTYLEQVIYEGRKTKSKKDKSAAGVNHIQLAAEAIKDLIVFFAEAGNYQEARAYFESITGVKSANQNLAKLAGFYADTGHKEEAKFLYKDLILQNEDSVKANDYQFSIVKLYGSSSPVVFKAELYSWIEKYGPKSEWQRINAKNTEALEKADASMEELLRNHVLQLHQTAQNTRTKTSQSAAREGYTLYFDTFLNARIKMAKIDEMHFFFGELLFDTNFFEEAAAQYSWIVEHAPNSTYKDKAILNSLLAYEKLLPSDEQIKKIVDGSNAPIEFNPQIKNFEQAAIRFIQNSPTSDNIVAVKYRMGSLYYLFNQFDNAIPILSELVKKHPRTPYAKYAANHLLDIYNLKNDYVGLQAAAQSMLLIPEIASSDVGAQISDIKLKTEFKLAKSLEDSKNYEGSAKAFEDFAMKNKTSNLAGVAVFNSASNYMRAGNILKSILMYGLVSSNKAAGNKELKLKADRELPALCEKTGQYQKAAQLYEQYARLNPKDSKANEFYYNAAAIFDGMNSYSEAIKIYEIYFDKFRGKDRSEVLFLISQIYERLGQLDKAISEYDKYLNSGTTNTAAIIEAHFKIASMHEKLGRKKISEEWYNKTIGVQRRLSAKGKKVGASYAAEAKFKLVLKMYQELLDIQIPKNPAKQGAAIQKKLSVLNSLKDEFKKVIAYDDAGQIVAALSTQGQSLQHVYSSIIHTPVPKGLKPEELKQYEEGVQKIADPFKEQAIEVYKTALSRGYALQGYNSYLITASENLNALQGKSSYMYEMEVKLATLPDWMTND
jgi:tetratricopeptide (TPR) repeat protein